MKKLLVVLLAALLIVTMGTPVLAAPSFSLSRDQFNFAYVSWDNGDPYLDAEETEPNTAYVKYEIRAGNVDSLDNLEYIRDTQSLYLARFSWVLYEGKEGEEPFWELREDGTYLDIEKGSFPLTRSSVSSGAALNLQSPYDDTSVNVIWDTIDVTPAATRTLENVNGVRYRVTQRATMATCLVSGSIHFTYWEMPPDGEETEPIEHTVTENIPEGCEGFLIAGTIMLQKVG